MYIVEKEKEKEIDKLDIALGFYTYILHTRIDIENENIYFAYYNNNKYYHISLDVKTRIDF